MTKNAKTNGDNKLRLPSHFRVSPSMAAAVQSAATQIAAERPGQEVGFAAAIRILVAEALIARKIPINP